MDAKREQQIKIVLRGSVLPPSPRSPSRLPSLVFLLIVTCAAASGPPASVVSHLPGFHGPLPFHLETGYVEVDEVNGGELFYYFIESEGEPSKDPLLLWLTGGPRCSALSGLVFEVGPLKFITTQYNGSLPRLVYHPYSWTQVANIIFLDSPLGSGFSFSQDYDGYYENDMSWSRHAHTFLVKWFKDHPQFLSNPLYISGDSYAGKIVPIVTQHIIHDIDAGKEPLLNLQGYIIGNPVTGGTVDENARVPYAYGMGIVSNTFLEMIEGHCKRQDYRSPTNLQCEIYLNTFNNQFLSEINKAHILEPKCNPDSARNPKSMSLSRRIVKQILALQQPPPFPDLSCRSYAYVLSYYWANHESVRRALRIRKNAPVKEWRRCRNELPYEKELNDNIGYHRSVLRRGYRALVYSGDQDMVIPFLGTQEWIRSLNSPVIDAWRSWFVDGQVVGYTEAYSNNLTFATVKNGGHTAPEYRPKECLTMLGRWISREPL